MTYSVEISRKFFGQLSKLDESLRTEIIYWLMEHLEGCENPYGHGSHLIRTRMSYQIEDYRILAEIQDSKIIILTARRRRKTHNKQEKN